MLSKKITNVLLVLSLSVFLFGAGYKMGEFRTAEQKVERPTYNILNAKDSNKVKNLDFALFWESWNTLEQKFVDKKKLDPQKMLYGAIKGMAASLEDPYTFFLTPDENKQSKADLEGKFEGIGAQLGLKENRIVVISPLKESPAQEAGLRSGDFITKVNKESTRGWTLPQAVSKIRGPKGTKVTLTIERSGKEQNFDIIRNVINVASVEITYEKEEDTANRAFNDFAYLKLNQFGTNTNDEWDQAVDGILDKWQKKQIKGMVLDLRDNPGGYLESSVYLASEFLTKGKLVVKQESTSKNIETREYRVVRSGRLLNIPLVVLVNKGSASASEILSGALRDHKRAVLVGEKTFGKGSVQEAINLKDEAGLHVTIAKWILPAGEWINGKGIEPNIKVENKIPEGETLSKETDQQLDRAIKEVIK